MKGFRVTDVATGRTLGTATYDGQQWHTTSKSIGRMVAAQTEGLGRTADEVLSYYDDWSNGYIHTAVFGDDEG